VATKTRKRDTASDPVQASLFSFDSDNRPNADILLSSLRSAGYTLETVIGDIVDNTIDAGAANVVVNLSVDGKADEWTLEVGDDGCGMDLETLDQMMRLGSRSEHDLSSDLGAFGLGSDTAALAIGRRKHVITSYEPGAWASSVWDLDVIMRERSFIKHLGDARTEEIALFAAAFAQADLEVPETGTLVRVTKGDRIGRTALTPAVKSVMKYLGETYRRFLVPNGGLTIWVNGQMVPPIDPMWREHPETMVLLDEQIDYTWRDEDGDSRTEKIGVFVVHLPDLGGQEANKDAGIRIDNSGFYVLRNGREIVGGTTLRTYTRHNEFSRFRVEINVPAVLDSQLGVSFLKSVFELKPAQGLRDKLDQVVGPYRRQSRKLYLQSRKDAPENVPHEEAAKQIKSRSPFLRKPEAEIERRGPRKPTDDGSKPESKPPERTRSPRARAQKSLADQATFDAKRLGATAPFYEGTLIGRKILVTYNADHPAYQRLILDNRDNRGQITAIDYLVWSLVAAEIRNVDDNSARFMEAMREDASFNLRQLLTV
jgi:Histidine kinase-, DNA gyrase B-, and HSP90-like ATPase